MKLINILILINVVLDDCMIARCSDGNELIPGQVENQTENHEYEQENKVGEKRKRIKWNPRLKSDLRRIWHETNPNKSGHRTRLKAKWDTTYPQYAHMNEFSLRNQAKFVACHEKPNENEGNTKVRWTKEMEADIMKIWHDTLSDHGVRASRMYEEWVKKYPMYSHMSSSYLLQRVGIIQKRRERPEEKIKFHYDLTRKHFGWNEQLKNELKEIWDKTKTKSNRGHCHRIHVEWAQRHPEYAYLTVQNVYQRAKVAKGLYKTKFHSEPKEKNTLTES